MICKHMWKSGWLCSSVRRHKVVRTQQCYHRSSFYGPHLKHIMVSTQIQDCCTCPKPARQMRFLRCRRCEHRKINAYKSSGQRIEQERCDANSNFSFTHFYRWARVNDCVIVTSCACVIGVRAKVNVYACRFDDEDCWRVTDERLQVPKVCRQMIDEAVCIYLSVQIDTAVYRGLVW